MTSHVDRPTLLAYISAQLGEEERTQVEEHADDCFECETALARLAMEERELRRLAAQIPASPWWVRALRAAGFVALANRLEETHPGKIFSGALVPVLAAAVYAGIIQPPPLPVFAMEGRVVVTHSADAAPPSRPTNECRGDYGVVSPAAIVNLLLRPSTSSTGTTSAFAVDPITHAVVAQTSAANEALVLNLPASAFGAGRIDILITRDTDPPDPATLAGLANGAHPDGTRLCTATARIGAE